MMKLIAGNRITLIVVAALAVTLISYFVIQYIQGAEEDKITIEIQEETNETRQRIKEAIRANPPADRNDATDSLRYLRERQGN